MMALLDKNAMGIRQKTLVKTYDNFDVYQPLDGSAERAEKARTLVGSQSKNVLFADGISAEFGEFDFSYGKEQEADLTLDVRTFFSYGEKGEDIGYIRMNGYCYIYDRQQEKFVQSEGVRFVTPCVIPIEDENGFEKVAIVGLAGVGVFDGEKWTVVCEDNLKGLGCYAQERLFFLTRDNRLFYSAPLDFCNFTESVDEGGYLDLRLGLGEPVGLVGLDSSVLIIRENGLEKLSLAGSSTDFVYRELPYKGSKIFSGFTVKGNGGAYFIATDGIYFCDGEKTEKVYGGPLEIQGADAGAYSVFHDGKLYFNFFDYYANGRKYFCFDTLSKKGGFISPLPGLTNIKGTLYALKDGKFKKIIISTYSAKAIGNQFKEENFFQADGLDFGVLGEKTIEKIALKGKGNVAVEVSSNRGKKRVLIALDEEKEEFVRLKGEKFSVRFDLSNGGLIRSVQFTLKTL